MTDKQREAILLSAVIVLGAGIRLSAPLAADFPLNDGGLFYQMILDLQQSKFILPVYTSYNFASIPYAYPPLAFYLYGIINIISGVPLLKLMQYLPALVSIGAIPAFYPLAKNILGDVRTALWATTVFALTPRTFDWLIMGGGATRSLGFLFALLTMRQAYKYFSDKSKKTFLFTLCFGTLVVLTHPEAAIHTALVCVFFYFWKDRTMHGALCSAAIGFSILAATAPWWFTVVNRHSINTFLAAISVEKNALYPLLGLFSLVKFTFTDEPYLQLISAMSLAGLFTLVSRSRLEIPIWVFLVSFIEPRGGTLYITLPIALSAGYFLQSNILSTMEFSSGTLKRVAWYSFAFFFTLYGFVNASSVANDVHQKLSLTMEDINAFAWVKANTDPNEKFLVITNRLPLNDSISEWFPALAKRKSQTTVFGHEWLDDDNLSGLIQDYNELQECSSKGIECLANWQTANENFHILVYEDKPMSISLALRLSQEYMLIYESERITVFKKSK